MEHERHFPSRSRRKRLDNLLKFALEAHGGLRAWEKLQGLRANVSVGGALWDLKHIPGEQGQGWYGVPGVYNEEQRVGWKRVTDAVHRAGGLYSFNSGIRAPSLIDPWMTTGGAAWAFRSQSRAADLRQGRGS
jgi:hypothetical protein